MADHLFNGWNGEDCLTDHLFNGWNGEDGATRADTGPATSPEASAPGPVLTSSDVSRARTSGTLRPGGGVGGSTIYTAARGTLSPNGPERPRRKQCGNGGVAAGGPGRQTRRARERNTPESARAQQVKDGLSARDPCLRISDWDLRARDHGWGRMAYITAPPGITLGTTGSVVASRGWPRTGDSDKSLRPI